MTWCDGRTCKHNIYHFLFDFLQHCCINLHCEFWYGYWSSRRFPYFKRLISGIHSWMVLINRCLIIINNDYWHFYSSYHKLNLLVDRIFKTILGSKMHLQLKKNQTTVLNWLWKYTHSFKLLDGVLIFLTSGSTLCYIYVWSWNALTLRNCFVFNLCNLLGWQIESHEILQDSTKIQFKAHGKGLNVDDTNALTSHISWILDVFKLNNFRIRGFNTLWS